MSAEANSVESILVTQLQDIARKEGLPCHAGNNKEELAELILLNRKACESEHGVTSDWVPPANFRKLSERERRGKVEHLRQIAAAFNLNVEGKLVKKNILNAYDKAFKIWNQRNRQSIGSTISSGDVDTMIISSAGTLTQEGTSPRQQSPQSPQSVQSVQRLQTASDDGNNNDTTVNVSLLYNAPVIDDGRQSQHRSQDVDEDEDEDEDDDALGHTTGGNMNDDSDDDDDESEDDEDDDGLVNQMSPSGQQAQRVSQRSQGDVRRDGQNNFATLEEYVKFLKSLRDDTLVRTRALNRVDNTKDLEVFVNEARKFLEDAHSGLQQHVGDLDANGKEQLNSLYNEVVKVLYEVVETAESYIRVHNGEYEIPEESEPIDLATDVIIADIQRLGQTVNGINDIPETNRPRHVEYAMEGLLSLSNLLSRRYNTVIDYMSDAIVNTQDTQEARTLLLRKKNDYAKGVEDAFTEIMRMMDAINKIQEHTGDDGMTRYRTSSIEIIHNLIWCKLDVSFDETVESLREKWKVISSTREEIHELQQLVDRVFNAGSYGIINGLKFIINAYSNLMQCIRIFEFQTSVLLNKRTDSDPTSVGVLKQEIDKIQLKLPNFVDADAAANAESELERLNERMNYKLDTCFIVNKSIDARSMLDEIRGVTRNISKRLDEEANAIPMQYEGDEGDEAQSMQWIASDVSQIQHDDRSRSKRRSPVHDVQEAKRPRLQSDSLNPADIHIVSRHSRLASGDRLDAMLQTNQEMLTRQFEQIREAGQALQRVAQQDIEHPVTRPGQNIQTRTKEDIDKELRETNKRKEAAKAELKAEVDKGEDNADPERLTRLTRNLHDLNGICKKLRASLSEKEATPATRASAVVVHQPHVAPTQAAGVPPVTSLTRTQQLEHDIKETSGMLRTTMDKLKAENEKGEAVDYRLMARLTNEIEQITKKLNELKSERNARKVMARTAQQWVNARLPVSFPPPLSGAGMLWSTADGYRSDVAEGVARADEIRLQHAQAVRASVKQHPRPVPLMPAQSPRARSPVNRMSPSGQQAQRVSQRSLGDVAQTPADVRASMQQQLRPVPLMPAQSPPRSRMSPSGQQAQRVSQRSLGDVAQTNPLLAAEQSQPAVSFTPVGATPGQQQRSMRLSPVQGSVTTSRRQLPNIPVGRPTQVDIAGLEQNLANITSRTVATNAQIARVHNTIYDSLGLIAGN